MVVAVMPVVIPVMVVMMVVLMKFHSGLDAVDAERFERSGGDFEFAGDQRFQTAVQLCGIGSQPDQSAEQHIPGGSADTVKTYNSHAIFPACSNL